MRLRWLPNPVRGGVPEIPLGGLALSEARPVLVRYAFGPRMPTTHSGRRIVCDAFEALAAIIADLAIDPDGLEAAEIECFGKVVVLKLSAAGLRLGAGRVLAFIPEGLSLADLNVALWSAQGVAAGPRPARTLAAGPCPDGAADDTSPGGDAA